ncbi:MAG: phospholipid transport system substrate-binding protein [Paracoccaceae bacterium]
MLNRSFIRTALLGLTLTLPLGSGMGSAAAQTAANANAPAAEPQPLRETAKPEALIADFNATLLTVMRDAKALKYAGRRDVLRKQLFDVYHLPVMARIAVGAHWRKLSPAQQTTLVTHFSSLTLATYANRFNGWSGEKFEIRGVQPVRDKTVLVKTAIIRPKGDPVEINYLMRRFQAGWKVIDVFLKESYSELATKRSEYSSVLRRQGFDALISQLDAKVAQFASEPN